MTGRRYQIPSFVSPGYDSLGGGGEAADCDFVEMVKLFHNKSGCRNPHNERIHSFHLPHLSGQIRWLGIMNLLAAPFVSCYLLLMALFAHGAELKCVPHHSVVCHPPLTKCHPFLRV